MDAAERVVRTSLALAFGLIQQLANALKMPEGPERTGALEQVLASASGAKSDLLRDLVSGMELK